MAHRPLDQRSGTARHHVQRATLRVMMTGADAFTSTPNAFDEVQTGSDHDHVKDSANQISVPSSYEVWLQGLKTHFANHRGAQAQLARYIAERRGTTVEAAQVTLSRISNGRMMPGADVFLDLATWLQQNQG